MKKPQGNMFSLNKGPEKGAPTTGKKKELFQSTGQYFSKTVIDTTQILQSSSPNHVIVSVGPTGTSLRPVKMKCASIPLLSGIGCGKAGVSPCSYNRGHLDPVLHFSA